MSLQNVTVNWDVSSATTAADAFKNVVTALSNAIGNFTLKTLEYNAAGQFTQGIIEQTNAAGQKLTRMFREQGGQLELTGTKFTEAAEKSKGFFNNIVIGFTTFARVAQTQIIHRVLGTLINEMQNSVGEAARLQRQISEIRTISQGTGLTFGYIAEQVRRLSDEFGKPQTDVAEAAYQALSNQVAKGADTFRFMNEALRLSRISMASAADSTNLLSSVMKSFGLEAGQEKPVVDALFKAIELGRFRAADLASAFGRVGPAAHAMGLSYQETFALMSAVSVKGINPSETLTQVSALMTSLMKPSAEMKKLLQETLGADTGKEAIEAHGIIGVLEALFKKMDEAPEHLGELLPNVRAMRPAFSLASEGGKTFIENLSEIKSASASANEALKIMGESAGDQLLKKVQSVKNFFVNDLGNDAVNAINSLLNAFNFLSSAATPIKIGAELMTAAIAAFVLTANSARIATVAWTSVNFLLGRSAVTAAAGITSLQVAGLGFAAIAAGVMALNVWSNSTISELQTGGDKLRAQLEANQKEYVDKQIEINNQLIESFQKLNKEAYQPAIKYAADQKAALANLGETLSENAKKSGEALKLGFEEYFRGIRDNINKYKREATEAETSIKRSKKLVEEFREKTGERAFERSVKFESDPGKQLVSYANRSQELKNQIIKDYRSGTDAGTDAARKGANDLIRIYEQEAEKQVTFREKLVAAGRGQQYITTEMDQATGQMVQRINVSDIVLGLQQKIADAQRMQTKEEETIQIAKDKTKKKNEELAAQENTRKDAMEQVAKKMIEFNTLDKSGKVKKEYQGPEGTKKAEKDYQSLVDQFIKLGGEDVENAVALNAAIQAKTVDVTKQTQAAILKEQVDSHQKELAESKKHGEEMYKQAVQNAQKQQQTQLTAGNAVKVFLKSTEDLGRLGPLVRYGGVPTLPEMSRMAAADKWLPQILKVKKEAEEAAAKAGDISLPEEERLSAADKLEAKLRVLGTLRLRISEARRRNIYGDDSQVTSVVPDELTNNKTTSAAIENVNELRNAIKEYQQALKQQDITKKFLDDTNLKIKEMGEKYEGLMSKIGGSADQVKIIKEPMGLFATDLLTISGNAKEATENLGKLGPKIAALQESLGKTPTVGVPSIPEPNYGVLAKPRALGGPINWTPQGIDTIPAMLAKDEFVINPASSRKFYTQLVQMNMGIQPKFFSEGGPVTTVGDINVIVQGQETPQRTVREIGRALDREIRRGTINFRRS